MNENAIKGNVPTANLAINKGRVKKYNKLGATPIYYLNKGTEFQIELFNPTPIKVLAKIKLNNNYISNSGIIIRPGERVFLDRYLDENKKFLFDTYIVNDTKEVKEAIKNNGDLVIEFYDETLVFSGGYNNNFFNKNVWQDTNWYNNGTSQPYFNSITTTNNLTQITGDVTSTVFNVKSSETGIIEKGGYSNQEFEHSLGTFNYFTSHMVTYKLLPTSGKPKDSSEIRRKYCHNCGGKIKTKNKYCPNCGAKQ